MSTIRWLGVGGIVVLGALGLAGPELIGQDPARQDLMARLLPPLSDGHPLGTDHLGRDLAARLLAGARITLSLAALAVASAACFGSASRARTRRT